MVPVSAGRSGSSAEQRVADALRAVPLTVLIFLLIDVVFTLIGQAYGASGLGPSGPLPTAQMFLVAAAAAAVMWQRPRAAILLTVVVVVLVVVAGPTGQEDWLLLITGVVAAARAGRRQVGLVALGQAGYALCFGLQAEHRHPGSGWPAGLTTAGIAAAGLAAGFVGRWFLVARDRRHLRVSQLAREQTEIRAVERRRLAGDLEAVVAQGLTTIEGELDVRARRPSDLASLRQGLQRIDRQCRSLLTELRALLEVLRGDAVPETGADAAGSGPHRSVDLFTARHVTMAISAVFVLLAVRVAVTDLGSGRAAELAVPVLALLACAVAVRRPVAGAVGAAVALVVAVVLDPGNHWDALPVALLCLIGTLRFGHRRVWLLVVAVAGYGGVLAWTGVEDLVGRTVGAGYAGFAAVAVGLAARYFVEARKGALRQLEDLTSDRERVETEERNAVARELHDVVAYQLSVTTMLVMATSMSDDPAALADTVAKVRRSTGAARQELSLLVDAMRSPGTGQQGPTPLIAPRVITQTLARRLTENGFHPVLDIDPDADDLDPTTQRTLGRIMQEATTNILRYTPAGSDCRYELLVGPEGVRLRIDSPLAGDERRSDLSLGWGLRGIRERVELTHGDFTAGPDRGRWVLTVALPATDGWTDPASASVGLRAVCGEGVEEMVPPSTGAPGAGTPSPPATGPEPAQGAVEPRWV